MYFAMAKECRVRAPEGRIPIGYLALIHQVMVLEMILSNSSECRLTRQLDNFPRSLVTTLPEATSKVDVLVKSTALLV